MKRIICFIGLVSLMAVWPVNRADAITFYGGNGIYRVMSANNVYQGDLWGAVNFSYTETHGAYTYRDGMGSINLLYGIRHALEVGVNQTVYQDRALVGSPSSGPMRISIKGSLPTSAPSSINLGGMLLVSLPIGQATNVEYESYISPKVAGGGMVIVSFDSNPIDLRRSKRVHINVGAIFHNDKRAYLGAGKNTTQILFGIGTQIPISNFMTFFTELSGERFTEHHPDILVSSGTDGRTPDYFRVTPGIRQTARRFIIQFGADIRLNSPGKFNAGLDEQPVYPFWKVFANVQFRLMEGIPPTYRRGRSMRISGRSYYQYGRRGTTDARGVGPGVIQNLEERQELLDQVERDLQEIREQRIKAQRELEDLKKSLENPSP